MLSFADRADAGRQLAPLLEKFRAENPLVLGLARGGVVVAAEVAAALGAPLDVLVARKVGVPQHEELAMGAVARGTSWLNERLIVQLGIPPPAVDRQVAAETHEVERREALYREGRPALPVKGRTVILVDDGIATGATAVAGVRALRQLGARRVVLAAPVCSSEGAERVGREAHAVVCAIRPPDFFAVSQAYESFPQLRDDEVCRSLEAAGSGAPQRR